MCHFVDIYRPMASITSYAILTQYIQIRKNKCTNKQHKQNDSKTFKLVPGQVREMEFILEDAYLSEEEKSPRLKNSSINR